jgi:hypothetical protein
MPFSGASNEIFISHVFRGTRARSELLHHIVMTCDPNKLFFPFLIRLKKLTNPFIFSHPIRKQKSPISYFAHRTSKRDMGYENAFMAESWFVWVRTLGTSPSICTIENTVDCSLLCFLLTSGWSFVDKRSLIETSPKTFQSFTASQRKQSHKLISQTNKLQKKTPKTLLSHTSQFRAVSTVWRIWTVLVRNHCCRENQSWITLIDRTPQAKLHTASSINQIPQTNDSPFFHLSFLMSIIHFNNSQNTQTWTLFLMWTIFHLSTQLQWFRWNSIIMNIVVDVVIHSNHPPNMNIIFQISEYQTSEPLKFTSVVPV